MTVSHNIYIHVPFCMSKCAYCAFLSRACRNPDWDAYATGIISEIDTWARRLGRVAVPTVFFGGGTPSLMPTDIFAKIMDALRKRFNIMPDAEITLESNPATIDALRLHEFVNTGVNRLSVGVQALRDDDLRFLGRRHTVRDAMELLDAGQRANIRVSADFIYAMPGWNAERVVELCRGINTLGLTHCSLYELTIEPGTPFAAMNLNMPSNDEMADMYTAIGETLNIPRYEVSNHSTPGNECRHNQNVWDGDAYIGIGDGAAGRVFMNDTWHEQTGGKNGKCQPMASHDRGVEMLITGMRTMRGARVTATTAPCINDAFVDAHPELVTRRGDRIAATQKGLLILDDLMIDLVK